MSRPRTSSPARAKSRDLGSRIPTTYLRWRIEVYYCDPYCSWQKPHVENAHTLLRRVLPKGTSFDGLTQADVDLICSHINSCPRAELGWRSPFEMLPEWGQENLPPAFGMRVVPRDEVNLTPSLVGM